MSPTPSDIDDGVLARLRRDPGEFTREHGVTPFQDSLDKLVQAARAPA